MAALDDGIGIGVTLVKAVAMDGLSAHVGHLERPNHFAEFDTYEGFSSWARRAFKIDGEVKAVMASNNGHDWVPASGSYAHPQFIALVLSTSAAVFHVNYPRSRRDTCRVS